MAAVQFRVLADGYDGYAEYVALRHNRPAEAAVLRDAIALIAQDPELAAKLHSVLLDPELGYRATPYLRAVGRLTSLTWRPVPEEDAVEVIDFDQPWGDLGMPAVWPRD